MQKTLCRERVILGPRDLTLQPPILILGDSWDIEGNLAAQKGNSLSFCISNTHIFT